MREELRLRFRTYYTIEGETEKHCYEAWTVVKDDGVTTDEELIKEIERVQTPIFEQAGYTIHKVDVYRASEFEYHKYIRNNEKAKYNRALQKRGI